jgi:hypothetical protein
MTAKTLLLILGLSGFVILSQAQAVSDVVYEGRQRYGLKMGTGLNSMYGGKLLHPRPSLGVLAGFYIHSKLDKKSPWGIQTGLDLRMRGSNFANGKPGDTAINRSYTKISIMSMDVPLLINYRLSKQRDVKVKQVQLGVQLGYNFNSILYVGPNKTPLPTALNTYNSIQTWDKLPLKTFDYQASLGFQQRGESLGYSIALKYGLRNLNNNFLFIGMVDTNGDGVADTKQELIAPTTDPSKEAPGTRQFIGTWSLEYALIF